MAKVTRYTVAGNTPYIFNVEGNISAKYYLFEYMDGATGINIMSTATIDPLGLGNNFSYGTFTNNITNSGVYLTIGNEQSFVSPNYIVDVSFPS
jgi:hypothetical protein